MAWPSRSAPIHFNDLCRSSSFVSKCSTTFPFVWKHLVPLANEDNDRFKQLLSPICIPCNQSLHSGTLNPALVGGETKDPKPGSRAWREPGEGSGRGFAGEPRGIEQGPQPTPWYSLHLVVARWKPSIFEQGDRIPQTPGTGERFVRLTLYHP